MARLYKKRILHASDTWIGGLSQESPATIFAGLLRPILTEDCWKQQKCIRLSVDLFSIEEKPLGKRKHGNKENKGVILVLVFDKYDRTI